MSIQIIEKNGRPEWAVIPYDEYVKIQELLEDIEDIIRTVVEENPGVVEDYKRGKKNAINRLVGEVMRRTGGRADARRVRKLLEELLS